MTQGVKHKWQGSTVGVTTGYAATKTVTSISKANPAVITSAGHGAKVGDLILVDAVTGMTQINGLQVVTAVTADSITLGAVDSTGFPTAAGGTLAVATFSNFCELTNFNRQGGSSAEMDGTTICSEAVETELGLPDFGTTQMDFHFAPNTVIQSRLIALDTSKELCAVKVTLPKAGGVRIVKGYVQQMSEQAGNGSYWTGSVTIRNTGRAIDVAVGA